MGLQPSAAAFFFYTFQTKKKRKKALLSSFCQNENIFVLVKSCHSTIFFNSGGWTEPDPRTDNLVYNIGLVHGSTRLGTILCPAIQKISGRGETSKILLR